MSALPSPSTLGLSHPLWASVSSVVSNGVWPDHTSQPFFFLPPYPREIFSPPPSWPQLAGTPLLYLGVSWEGPWVQRT